MRGTRVSKDEKNAIFAKQHMKLKMCLEGRDAFMALKYCTTTLHGLKEPCQQLNELLQRSAKQRENQSLIIIGPRGSGKSMLLSWALSCKELRISHKGGGGDDEVGTAGHGQMDEVGGPGARDGCDTTCRALFPSNGITSSVSSNISRSENSSSGTLSVQRAGIAGKRKRGLGSAGGPEENVGNGGGERMERRGKRSKDLSVAHPYGLDTAMIPPDYPFYEVWLNGVVHSDEKTALTHITSQLCTQLKNRGLLASVSNGQDKAPPEFQAHVVYMVNLLKEVGSARGV